MKLKVFSVFDSKVKAYMQPFYARSTGEALRMFEDAVARKEGNFFAHAEDFTLFELGSFDDSNASFEFPVTPVPLGKAIEFLPSNGGVQ